MKFPTGFVYLKEIESSIIQDIRYATHNNFIGRPIAGYLAANCIMTLAAANALKHIQRKINLHLAQKGNFENQFYSLKIFDAYRPQRAVNDFISWSNDSSDQTMKKIYYPNVDKKNFFKLNYLASKSGHSRGSTVDLTITRVAANGEEIAELNMGTPFDFMDELSHTLNPLIKEEALKNRLLLRNLMTEANFKPIEHEWWHFTIENEPFPDTYFDFDVK